MGHFKRPENQIWLLFTIESPAKILKKENATYLAKDNINWTATYRHDSDIPTPYAKFFSYPYKLSFDRKPNYASGKTKKVAWFVSNCNDTNGRMKYVRQLQKHIQVDIYGL